MPPTCPVHSSLLSFLFSSSVHLFLTSDSDGLRQTHGALQAACLLPLRPPPLLATAAGVGATLCSAACSSYSLDVVF